MGKYMFLNVIGESTSVQSSLILTGHLIGCLRKPTVETQTASVFLPPACWVASDQGLYFSGTLSLAVELWSLSVASPSSLDYSGSPLLPVPAPLTLRGRTYYSISLLWILKTTWQIRCIYWHDYQKKICFICVYLDQDGSLLHVQKLFPLQATSEPALKKDDLTHYIFVQRVLQMLSLQLFQEHLNRENKADFTCTGVLNLTQWTDTNADIN